MLSCGRWRLQVFQFHQIALIDIVNISGEHGGRDFTTETGKTDAVIICNVPAEDQKELWLSRCENSGANYIFTAAYHKNQERVELRSVHMIDDNFTAVIPNVIWPLRRESPFYMFKEGPSDHWAIDPGRDGGNFAEHGEVSVRDMM